MIIFIGSFIIDVYYKEFEFTKNLYPQFGKVVEGKGYMPSVDFAIAEEIYRMNDDGHNPFIPLFIGELKRIKKQPFEDYYRESISRIKNLSQAVIIDLVFINGMNFKWSNIVKDKIHNIYEEKNIKADYYISKIYEKKGWEEKMIGNSKTSLHLIASAIDVAPMRRELALQGFKLTLTLNMRDCFVYLLRYLKSYKYINNSVFLIYNTLTFLIIFTTLFIISIIIYSFQGALKYISRLFSLKIKLREFWIPGICYALVVFSPWKIFVPIFIFIAIIFVSRKKRIFIGFLLIFTGILCGFKIPFDKYLRNNNNLNVLNSFYDPVNNTFETERKEIYNQWLKGIALLKIEESHLARDIFKEMFRYSKEKEKILNNIGVSFYIEKNYDSSLVYFLEAEKKNFPEIEYVYFNIAKNYAKLLDFTNSTKYFSKIEKLKGHKYEIYDFYPDEKSIYGTIIRNFNFFNLYSLIFLISGFILFFISFVFKKEIFVSNCSICKNPILILHTTEEISICEKCYEKTSFSQSKSLKKRIMKLIEMKSKKMMRVEYIIMNLFLPGSVHINKGFIFEGLFFLCIYNFVILNLFGNLFYNLPVSLYTTPVHGFLILIITMSIFYIILILSTGKIVEYGA